MEFPPRRRRARARSPGSAGVTTASCSSSLARNGRRNHTSTLSAYACCIGLFIAAAETAPAAVALKSSAAFVNFAESSMLPPQVIPTVDRTPWAAATAPAGRDRPSSSTNQALTAFQRAVPSAAARISRSSRWQMYRTPTEPRRATSFSRQPAGLGGYQLGGGGVGGAGRERFGRDVVCLGSSVRDGCSIGGDGRGGISWSRESRRGRAGVAGRPLYMSMAEGEGEGNGETSRTAVSAIAFAGLAAVLYGLQHSQGGSTQLSLDSLAEIVRSGPSAAGNAVQAFLDNTFDKVDQMGPLGPLYFGAVYVLAEVVAIPALPFTAAAGYLFGLAAGTAIVLASATIAAGFSFLLGRTLLRSQVENLLAQNPKFTAIDKAIGKEGFKIILLLRLSPIFPFALSNYFYGVTAVGFTEYMAGTMLGFFPGTLAYVYGGMVGKAITDGSGGMSLPWYGYAAGAVLIGALLKTVGDIATNAVEEMEPGIREE